jgi:3-isopropylmalate/(R)-2-methylmalate dehydratase small subunit
MRFEGRVWKFGHNVDTDVITPGKYLSLETKELAKHTLEVLDPRFAAEVKRGDLLVAGRNFGCGSSREEAPHALRELGVGCVLAETFARIFYRNSIAIGLPVLACPGLWQAVEAGDVISVDLSTGKVRVASGVELAGAPLPERMLEVLREGGILPALKRFAASKALLGSP